MKNLKDIIIEKLHINKDTKSYLDKKDVVKISKALVNSGENSGFKKGIDLNEIYVDQFISMFNGYSEDSDFDAYSKMVVKEAKERKLDLVIVIDGNGYNGRWGMVTFFNVNPYEYMIYHSYCSCSKLLSSKTAQEAIDDILNFVE